MRFQRRIRESRESVATRMRGGSEVATTCRGSGFQTDRLACSKPVGKRNRAFRRSRASGCSLNATQPAGCTSTRPALRQARGGVRALTLAQTEDLAEVTRDARGLQDQAIQERVD